MKKKIGIFIFIVICSTVMLSDWIERIYIGRLAGLPGRYNSYVGIQKEQKDSIDMLVLGDSESMTSISPMELWKSTGITSYICGQSGQRISESYYMLKHALDYQSPQVVLLETNMLFRYTNTPDSLRSSISDTAMYYFPVLQYAGKYGIPYIDFNQKLKELGIDWKNDTLDKGDHLNLSGAHKVTDYMTMYLQEHYMLPDHRGDEKFTSWDTMASQYITETGY